MFPAKCHLYSVKSMNLMQRQQTQPHSALIVSLRTTSPAGPVQFSMRSVEAPAISDTVIINDSSALCACVMLYFVQGCIKLSQRIIARVWWWLQHLSLSLFFPRHRDHVHLQVRLTGKSCFLLFLCNFQWGFCIAATCNYSSLFVARQKRGSTHSWT